MQVKTLTYLGVVLAVICLLQVASGSKNCQLAEFNKVADKFCAHYIFKPVCKALLSGIKIACIGCDDADNSSSNITTTTPPAADD